MQHVRPQSGSELLTGAPLAAPQIVPWFSFSVPGAMHLMVLTVTAAAAFGCYVAAVVTDPGACAIPPLP